MKIKEFISKGIVRNCVSIVLLLIIMMLSVTVVSKFATSPENYKTTIRSIDEKKATVMGVTATAAITSTALAAIPGDATTPIANQLMELSSYLLIVVCALVLEKSLLTVMGYMSFNLLIPIACVLMGIYVFTKKKSLKIFALKFVAFALVIVVIIPFSMKISDMIYESNQATVEQLTTNLEDNAIEDNTEEKSWLDKMVDKVKDSVSDVGEKAKQILNSFIDAIALFIITYCALPLIIVLIVIWFVNFLFKLNITVPSIDIKRIGKKKKYTENSGNEDKELMEV